VVTREELHDKLWSQDTCVDFEHGLNKAINKVREALGDDADNPRFVETLPGRGYRFLAPVTQPSQPNVIAVEKVGFQAGESPLSSPALPNRRPVRWSPWLLVATLAGLTIFFAVVFSLPSRPPHIVRYVQLTNDGRKKSGVLSTAITTDNVCLTSAWLYR
jgi:Transcriptional regulatory protein, C terminal